eukprot:scaffold5773_cov36-Tisochrysis_lutea.AAC.1
MEVVLVSSGSPTGILRCTSSAYCHLSRLSPKHSFMEGVLSYLYLYLQQIHKPLILADNLLAQGLGGDNVITADKVHQLISAMISMSASKLVSADELMHHHCTIAEGRRPTSDASVGAAGPLSTRPQCSVP